MRRSLLACAVIFPLLCGPALTFAALPEKFPAETLVYVGWPGRDRIAEAYQDTAMARILAEPEMAGLKKQLLPALDALIRAQIGGGDEEKAYEQAKVLLQAIYTYPTAVALINVNANTMIPIVDAGVIVEAGEASAELAASLEAIFEAADMPMHMIKSVDVGPWKMRELAILGPAFALRWGAIDNCLVVSFGNKLLRHLVPEYLPAAPQTNTSDPASEPAPAEKPSAANLAESPLFRQALQAAGGSPDLPLLFVNLERTLLTAEAFQPMLSAFGVPVVGEAGGLRKLLGEIGAGDPKSLTVACAPNAGGLQTTLFFHSPGLKAAQPLTEADLKVVPQTASWASAGQMNLLRIYNTVLQLVNTISPRTHDQVMDIVGEIESRLGMKLGDDLLGSFGNTWIFFDDPQTGSLLFTGTTVVVDVKPNNKLDEALRNLIGLIAEESGSRDEIAVREEDYRGTKITYMNFSGLPVPAAPAWAIYENRCILALYPQMVRVTLSRLMDKQAKTLLDNPDFQRGWKLMPPNASSMSYVDAVRGVRQLYSVALPLADALIAMGQPEGLTLDASIMPSLPSITPHLFASVSGGATTSDGYLLRTHGAIPGTLASLSQASVAGPLAVSIAIPALVNARQQAKRTVSMANLKGIGMAVIVYATEHEGKLPPDLKTLVDAGAISDKALVSPLDDDPGDEGSYVYVGAGLTTDMGPDLIVAYEKFENHGGYMTNAVFLDGHVEFTMRDRVDQLVERAKEQIQDQDRPQDKDGDSKDQDGDLQKQLDEEKQEEGGIPAAKVMPANPLVRRAETKERLAEALVSPSGPLSSAIDTFRLELGRYPERLSELSEKPTDEEDAKKWNGPYIRNTGSIKDPWGRPIEYQSPGKDSNMYRLWSVGPDGESGTDDDIKNW